MAQQKVDPLGVSVVAQLYDVEEGNVITAMDSYLNYVFLGYESGMLQRLEIQFDEEDASNIYTAVSHTDFGTQPRRKNRIKQLIHSNVEPFLVILCHQQLSILASETFQVLKQVATDVGCCSLSLATPMSLQASWNSSSSSNNNKNNNTRGRAQTAINSNNDDSNTSKNDLNNSAAGGGRNSRAFSTLIHRICSSEKEARGLSVHEFCFSSMSLKENVDNFVFPERVRCVAEANGFLYVGLSREYSVLSMESGDVRRLVPLNGCVPQIAICDPNYGYFLLESVIFSVGVDKMPQSSNAAVISFENSVTPNAFTIRPGTLFSFTDRHCVVYSTLLQRQLQKLAIPECQFVSHKNCEVLLPPPYGGTVVTDGSSSTENNSSSQQQHQQNVAASPSSTSNHHPLALQSTPGHAGSSNRNVYSPLDDVPAPVVFVASKTRLHMLRMFPVEKQLRELVVKRFRIDCAEDLLRSYNISPVLAGATERLERLTKVMAGFSRLRRGLVEEGLATFASLVDVRQILRLTPSLVAGCEKTSMSRPSFLAAIANCPERCADVFLYRLRVREEKKRQKLRAQKQKEKEEKQLQQQQNNENNNNDDNNDEDEDEDDEVSKENIIDPTAPLPTCPHYQCGTGSCSRCPHTPTLQFVLNMIYETSSGQDAQGYDKKFWSEWSLPAIVQPTSSSSTDQSTSGSPTASSAAADDIAQQVKMNSSKLHQPFMYDARVENLELEWESRIDFEKIRSLQLEQHKHAVAAARAKRAAGGPNSTNIAIPKATAPLNNKNEFLKYEITNLWSRFRLSLQGYLTIFVDESLRGQRYDLATTAEGARRAAEYALLVLNLLGATDQQRHEAALAAVRGDISCAKPPKKPKSMTYTQELAVGETSAAVASATTLTSLDNISSDNNNNNKAAADATSLAPFQPLHFKILRRGGNIETYPIVNLLKTSQSLPIRDCIGLFGATQEWRLMLLLARTRERIPAEADGTKNRWSGLLLSPEEGEKNASSVSSVVKTSTENDYECFIPQEYVEKVQGQLRVNPARDFFTKHLSVWRLLHQAGACTPPHLQKWCRETLGIQELPKTIIGKNDQNENKLRSNNNESDDEIVTDDVHPAFIALEHLNTHDLKRLHKSDNTVLRRLRDSDGLTVLHHLVFILASSHVEERIDLMLMVENSNEQQIRDHQEQNESSSSSSSPKLKHINHYGAGTKLSGPTREDRMNLIRNLVRFFVEECGVPVDVRAPCILDQEERLLCFTPAELATALSYAENGNNTLRFVHSLDSAIVAGALCASSTIVSEKK